MSVQRRSKKSVLKEPETETSEVFETETNEEETEEEQVEEEDWELANKANEKRWHQKIEDLLLKRLKDIEADNSFLRFLKCPDVMIPPEEIIYRNMQEYEALRREIMVRRLLSEEVCLARQYRNLCDELSQNRIKCTLAYGNLMVELEQTKSEKESEKESRKKMSKFMKQRDLKMDFYKKEE